MAQALKADVLAQELVDLLRARGWVVWTGPRLGSWWASTPSNPTPVPDVYAMALVAFTFWWILRHAEK